MNYDESKVPRYELPDPLVSFDGRTVSDAATWPDVRRPEILRAFAEHVYGWTPEIKTSLRSKHSPLIRWCSIDWRCGNRFAFGGWNQTTRCRSICCCTCRTAGADRRSCSWG